MSFQKHIIFPGLLEMIFWQFLPFCTNSCFCVVIFRFQVYILSLSLFVRRSTTGGNAEMSAGALVGIG